MISILIPTYNAVCLSLIEKMYKQAIALRIPFEILLADDASCENIRQQNRKMRVFLPMPYCVINTEWLVKNNLPGRETRNLTIDLSV